MPFVHKTLPEKAGKKMLGVQITSLTCELFDAELELGIIILFEVIFDCGLTAAEILLGERTDETIGLRVMGTSEGDRAMTLLVVVHFVHPTARPNRSPSLLSNDHLPVCSLNTKTKSVR